MSLTNNKAQETAQDGAFRISDKGRIKEVRAKTESYQISTVTRNGKVIHKLLLRKMSNNWQPQQMRKGQIEKRIIRAICQKQPFYYPFGFNISSMNYILLAKVLSILLNGISNL